MEIESSDEEIIIGWKKKIKKIKLTKVEKGSIRDWVLAILEESKFSSKRS